MSTETILYLEISCTFARAQLLGLSRFCHLKEGQASAASAELSEGLTNLTARWSQSGSQWLVLCLLRAMQFFEQTKKSLSIDREAAKSASLLPPGSCILTDYPTHFFSDLA